MGVLRRREKAVTPEQFRDLISTLTVRVQDKPLDGQLEIELNQAIPPGGEIYESVFGACRGAIEAGWMCKHEAQGIRYGRVIKPGAQTHGFSVDVVEMHDLEGPHHRHPMGEIDMVMPLTAGAQFDGRGAGWRVYPPGSAHKPTVTHGRALVLYLLPQGRIEFTEA